MVLAMINVGSAIPALMRSKGQKKCLKVVVLSDLRLCLAAFPAFYTHSREWQKLFMRSYKVNFQNGPNLHFVLFWRTRFKNMKGKSVKKGRDWIMEKKERRRRQGRWACSLATLTKIFLFGMLSHDISLLTVDTFSPVLCLLACREVRADTKYTGRQRRPHF